jgi:hypothetical protein
MSKLRRRHARYRRGEPDYDLQTPQMAEATRSQLAVMQQRFSALGAIESVTFVEFARRIAEESVHTPVKRGDHAPLESVDLLYSEPAEAS